MQAWRRGGGPRTVLVYFALALTAGASTVAAQGSADRLDLAVQSDQALAILDLLERRDRGEPVPEEAWDGLFATEGHRRTMDRERAMNERLGWDRGFSDEAFRAWAESDAALEGLAARRAALDAWAEVDLDRAATMALDYLPPWTRLRGTIYPIYREQQNSFVHELGGAHPAIFMYLAADIAPPALEYILAHELHHVGLMAACPRDEGDGIATAILGGFGEGLAVLASAGGPDRPTHPFDGPDITGNWSRRIDSLAVDMAAFEAFMDSVLTGSLTAAEAGSRVFRFSSAEGMPQGPLYSVGWHMAVTVERELGRETLIDGMCRPERLLLDYDAAAARVLERQPPADLPRWSPEFLDRLRDRQASRAGEE